LLVSMKWMGEIISPRKQIFDQTLIYRPPSL
jgi:hypothetical protein